MRFAYRWTEPDEHKYPERAVSDTLSRMTRAFSVPDAGRNGAGTITKAAAFRVRRAGLRYNGVLHWARRGRATLFAADAVQ